MTQEPPAPPAWMIQSFSRPRLAGYLRASGGDPGQAERLYWWNVEASAALYGPLHCLEISLRNALHHQLRAAYGRPDWWLAAPLNEGGRRLTREAGRKGRRRGPGPVAPDHVVAELNFGFWVSLLSKGGRGGQYDRQLWVPALHKAFPHYAGRRDELHGALDALRLLRNRVMHHEPIHHRDLALDHRMIYRVLGWISTEAAKEIQVLDRFPAVLTHRAATCGGGRSPRF
ncbi:hypothetical protein ACFVUW_24645 [Streptomyces xiamenensis]|uniref:hypothetical protein n=1 Tax=Streptomyces xiamenensis TaxID=408015 RepID=UPI0036E3B008